MPAFILTIAGWFGISPLRIIIYASVAVAIIVGALTIRQHYIDLGWKKAISAVKQQDDRAKAAAERVDQKANECSSSSYWDVITSTCKVDQ